MQLFGSAAPTRSSSWAQGPQTIVGGNDSNDGADCLIGGGGGDLVFGNGGNDIIIDPGGNDTYVAGFGNDSSARAEGPI